MVKIRRPMSDIDFYDPHNILPIERVITNLGDRRKR